MVKSRREKPWLCLMSGYLMDATHSINGPGDVLPKEHDLSLCMNCGSIYVRHNDRWSPITDAERANMTPDERASLDQTETARKVAIRTDLARERGGLT